MSISNPTDSQPNPCARWFQWGGGGEADNGGTLSYWDKDKEERINIGGKFRFILMDTLSVVKGFHEPSNSNITSNEIRDSKAERLVVKAFKGGILAEGFYAAIRDRVKAVGGHFTSSLYLAFKSEQGNFQVGNLQLKGAALQSWMEFCKVNKAQYDAASVFAKAGKAVAITGFTEDKKGKIVFRVPVFKLIDMTPETKAEVTKLDKEILLPFLTGYFKRTRIEQVSAPAEPQTESEPPTAGDNPPDEPVAEPQPEEDANTPF
jgi:hypothetical protein